VKRKVIWGLIAKALGLKYYHNSALIVVQNAYPDLAKELFKIEGR